MIRKNKFVSQMVLTVLSIGLFLPIFSVLPSDWGGPTTVHAEETSSSSEETETSSSEKEKEKEPDTATTNAQSDWNKALSQLSQSAIQKIGGNQEDTPANNDEDAGKIATLDSVIADGGDLNAWGFMGISNTDLWEKNNNASATASYTGLLNLDGSDPVVMSYRQSARFAYILQASGLDQPMRAGFTKTNNLHKVMGGIMNISYFISDSANSFFKMAMNLFKSLNPIEWALRGSASGNMSPALQKLVDLIAEGYRAFQQFGLGLIGIFVAVYITLAVFGVSIGGRNKSQASALTNTFLNILKRFFVFAALPTFGLFFFQMLAEVGSDAFETEQVSVPNYAVYGSLVDFNGWVMTSRLGIPSGIQFDASFSDKKLPAFTHNDLVKINAYAAGHPEAKGLVGNSSGFTLTGPDVSKNEDTDNKARNLLSVWGSGTSVTASDFASAASSSIRKDNKNNEEFVSISEELLKPIYNTNSTNRVVDRQNANSYFTGATNRNTSSALPAKSDGGLSTMGMYSYLLTTATDSNLSVSNTENLANGVDQAGHRSVVLAGTGATATGNLIWAFGLIVGITIIIVGYLMEVLKSFITSIPSLSVSVFRTGMMSFAGGVQFVSILAGLAITIFGSALMYLIAQATFITLSQMGDELLLGMMSNSNVVEATANFGMLGELATGASTTAMQTAFNILYGLFLLWMAFLLVRYRGIICAAIAEGFEEGFNKVLVALSSVSDTSSRGTNGAVLSSTNISQGSGPGGLVSTLSKTAIVGAGGAGLASAIGNDPDASGKDTHDSSKEKETKDSNSLTDKQSSDSSLASTSSRDNSSLQSKGVNSNSMSSLRNQGTAAERTGTERSNTNTLDGNSGLHSNINSNDQYATPMSTNASTNKMDTNNAQDVSNEGSRAEGTNANTNSNVNQDANYGQNKPLGVDSTNGDTNSLTQGAEVKNMATDSGLVQNANDNSNMENRGVNQNGLAEANANGVTTQGMNTDTTNTNNDSDRLVRSNTEDMAGLGINNTSNSNMVDGATGQNGVQTNNSEQSLTQQNTEDLKSSGINDSTNRNVGVNDNNQSLTESNSDNLSTSGINDNQTSQDSTATNNTNGSLLQNGQGVQDQLNSETTGVNSNMTNQGLTSNGLNSGLGTDSVDSTGLGSTANTDTLSTSGLGTGSTDSVSTGTSGVNTNTVSDSLTSSSSANTNAVSNTDMQSSKGLGSADSQQTQSKGVVLGASTPTQSSYDARSGLGQANSDMMVPVNRSVDSGSVMSKMNDVQLANQNYERAQQMASSNPSNTALANKASQAQSQLSSVQSGAMSMYQAQPVSANPVHAGLMAKGAPMNDISVGSVDKSIGAVHSAQQSYDKAVSSYGATSSQAQQAQQSLVQAQESATELGISPDIVSNPTALSEVNNQLMSAQADVQSGSWTQPSSDSVNSGNSRLSI